MLPSRAAGFEGKSGGCRAACQTPRSRHSANTASKAGAIRRSGSVTLSGPRNRLAGLVIGRPNFRAAAS